MWTYVESKGCKLRFWQIVDSSIFDDAQFNVFPFQEDGKAQKQWYTNWLTWSFDHVLKNLMVKADTVATDLFVWHQGSRIGVDQNPKHRHHFNEKSMVKSTLF